MYNVLRVVSGPNGAEPSLQFHYDATVITALVPLFIPQGPPQEAGDLITFPNLRPLRKSGLNILEKILVQNPISRVVLDAFLRRRNYEGHIKKLIPGNVYLFWGYRTLHANLPVRPNELRSTLLFHLGDPHRGSRMTRAVVWLRRPREKRRLAP